MPVSAAGISALIPQQLDLYAEVLPVRDDHSTFAGGDDLVAEEAENANIADGADRVPLVGCSLGFGGVLQNEETASAADREDRIHVNGMPVEMDHHYSLRPRSHAPRNFLGSDRPGLPVAIRENGSRTAIRDGVRRGDVSERRHDDLVPWADA